MYYEMAKLNSKKRKNCAFAKKKSLVGLTPDALKEKLFCTFSDVIEVLCFVTVVMMSVCSCGFGEVSGLDFESVTSTV